MTINTLLPDGYFVRAGNWEHFDGIFRLNGEFLIERYGGNNATIEEVRAEWNVDNWDMAGGTRCVYAPDGTIIAFMRVWDYYDVPVRPYVWGFVSKAHRGRGIGTALMQWAVERSYMVIPRVPEHARVTIKAFALATNPDENAIMQQLGFEKIRQSHVMQINLDAPPDIPPLPGGLRMVSLAEYDNLEAFVRIWRQSFVDHRGYIEMDINKLVADQERHQAQIDYFDPSLWLLVLDGTTPVATCWGYKQTEESATRGLIDQMGVIPAYRRRGIGMAMLKTCFRRIYEAESPEIVLGVDGASLTNAVRLYERAGMHIALSHNMYERIIREGEELTQQGQRQ